MSTIPPCPECDSAYSYQDQDQMVCPDCGHEWNPRAEAEPTGDSAQIKDAFGNDLQDGDSITIIKDLKVKGASQALKVGTKVKSIRLVDGDHNIDCKIPGFGAMKLKSEFVKKA
jgi:protein PhnA